MSFDDVDGNRNPLNPWPVMLPGMKTLADRLQRDRRWVFVGGLLYTVLGYCAFVRPFAATLGLNVIFGLLLIVVGIVQLVNMFRWREFGGTHVLQSLIASLAGAVMLRLPAIGLIGMTMIITFYLFTSAVARWMAAEALRPHRGWGMLLFNSIISFMLGIILLIELPVSALWAPGLFLGVDLLITGIAMIALSFALRAPSGEVKRFPNAGTRGRAA
jgi:uncharacterized membrane protein HdeD (DUF308 family)